MITYNEANFLKKESLNKEITSENFVNFQGHSKTLKVFEVFPRKVKSKSVFIVKYINLIK